MTGTLYLMNFTLTDLNWVDKMLEKTNLNVSQHHKLGMWKVMTPNYYLNCMREAIL